MIASIEEWATAFRRMALPASKENDTLSDYTCVRCGNGQAAHEKLPHAYDDGTPAAGREEAGYAPTTEHLRSSYAIADPPFTRPANVPERAHEFDRWLARHNAEVRAQAMEEAAWIAEATQTAELLISPRDISFAKDARSRLIADRIRSSAAGMRAQMETVKP